MTRRQTSTPPAARQGTAAPGAKAVQEPRTAPVTRPASGGAPAGLEAPSASGLAIPAAAAGPADLTEMQRKVLFTGIQSDRVQRHRGNAHLEAWDVRRTLTRIFGFGGWSDQTLELVCIREHAARAEGGETRWWVAYRAQVRLIVRTLDGRVLSFWDDTAVGEAQKQVGCGTAHDQAAKTALSQALKRCAANLGDQLGLSLYRDGELPPVVLWSAAHPPPHAEGPAVGEVGPGATDDPDTQFAEAVLEQVGAATTTTELNRLWVRVDEEVAAGLPRWDASRLRDAMRARFLDLPVEAPPAAVAAAQDAAAETPGAHPAAPRLRPAPADGVCDDCGRRFAAGSNVATHQGRPLCQGCAAKPAYQQGEFDA